MKYLPLCILGLLIQGAFIIIESRKKYRLAVIAKGCASLVYVIIGINAASQGGNAGFVRLIVTGLICGAIGDILLNLRFLFKNKGQIVFLAGHIIYLAALLLWRIFAAVGPIKPAFKIFGILYIGIISLMTAVAVSKYISVPTSGRLLFMIGAVLFLLSDVIMILNTFGSKARQSLRTANLLFYYLGQLLIALCLALY